MEDRENRSQMRCGIKLRFFACLVRAGQGQSAQKVGEGWRKGALLRERVNLESEYLATGLSLRALEGLRESFIAKVKSEHNEKRVGKWWPERSWGTSNGQSR